MEVIKIIVSIVGIICLIAIVFCLAWSIFQDTKNRNKEHTKKMKLYVQMEATLYAVERLAKKRMEVIDYYNDIQGDNNG